VRTCARRQQPVDHLAKQLTGDGARAHRDPVPNCLLTSADTIKFADASVDPG